MRDLFKTVMTSSMVAGAALLVSACGGETTEVENTTVVDPAADPMMDGATNDVTAVDGAMGTDANMMMDANMMDANMSTENMMMNDMMSNDADTNLANGM